MAKKSSRKRIIVIVIVAILLVALGYQAVFRKKGKTIEVQVEEAEKGDITSVVTAIGSVKARTDVKISADVMGRIVDLPVREGQDVKTGDLLVRIDPAEYEADVNRLKASLLSARAFLEKARIAYNRNRELYKRNLISKEELDMSESDYNSAEANVSQAEAGLDQARDKLNKTTIRAPMDGKITALNSEKGENVVIGTMNNPGTVIMVISDMSAIEIDAQVDETDIAYVKKGQDVAIELDAFPDTTLKGSVTEIGNSAMVTGSSAQNQVVNFLVTILIKDDVEGIRPGMSATVDITTAERYDVVVVPIQSIVMRKPSDTLTTENKDGGGSESDSAAAEADDKEKEKEEPLEGVFVVKEGIARFVPVTTGIADQQNIEIEKGIAEGDSIITGRYKVLRSLKPGDHVKPEK